MSRAETAIEQLYEDMDVRDELTDDEASALFAWAEAQALRLDAESADDSEFEEKLSKLRGLLKSLNRAVGKYAYATPDELNEALAKVAAAAQSVNLALGDTEADAQEFQAQGAVDNAAFLHNLLNRLGSSIPVSSEAEAAEPMSPSTDDAVTLPPSTNPSANLMEGLRGAANSRPAEIDNQSSIQVPGESSDV